MSKPPPFPSIDSELTPAPRQRLDLKTLKPREPIADEAVEANSRAIGQKWGASTQLPVTEDLPRPAPTISTRSYLPDYLDQELSMRSAERRVTKNYLIMEALVQAGYRVDKVDLIEDRRRSGQKGKV
jgi:hypothetical protein